MTCDYTSILTDRQGPPPDSCKYTPANKFGSLQVLISDLSDWLPREENNNILQYEDFGWADVIPPATAGQQIKFEVAWTSHITLCMLYRPLSATTLDLDLDLDPPNFLISLAMTNNVPAFYSFILF